MRKVNKITSKNYYPYLNFPKLYETNWQNK